MRVRNLDKETNKLLSSIEQLQEYTKQENCAYMLANGGRRWRAAVLVPKEELKELIGILQYQYAKTLKTKPIKKKEA